MSCLPSPRLYLPLPWPARVKENMDGRYGRPGDRAARAPQRSIYFLLVDGPALARAGLASDVRDGSSLTEGMGRNRVGVFLRGLVSALPSPLSWLCGGEALRFSLRGSGAGIRIPSRQWDEAMFWQKACTAAVFGWYLMLVARTQSSCEVTSLISCHSLK